MEPALEPERQPQGPKAAEEEPRLEDGHPEEDHPEASCQREEPYRVVFLFLPQ